RTDATQGGIAMSLVRNRALVPAALAGLALFTVGAPSGAQQSPAAPQAQAAPPAPPAPAAAPAAGQAPRGGGRPQTPALGDGPWDFTTEKGHVHVTVVTKGLD